MKVNVGILYPAYVNLDDHRDYCGLLNQLYDGKMTTFPTFEQLQKTARCGDLIVARKDDGKYDRPIVAMASLIIYQQGAKVSAHIENDSADKKGYPTLWREFQKMVLCKAFELAKERGATVIDLETDSRKEDDVTLYSYLELNVREHTRVYRKQL
jgi:hypothetical protein